MSATVAGMPIAVVRDRAGGPLREQAGDLADDIARWAPDVSRLTHAKRLNYDVAEHDRKAAAVLTA